MDPLFRAALDARRALRAEFEDYRTAEYVRAEDECRGAMLNARGRDAGVGGLELFMGTEARAQAYASPELREWWAANGRPTFESFLDQRARYAVVVVE